MPKPPKKLHIRIPAYGNPRNSWRLAVHAAVRARQQDPQVAVRYEEGDKLELELRLYFDASALRFHDVDNRLKDVLDALQGRAGGSKAVRTLEPIVPNDKQIYRVVVEKEEARPQSRGLGHLTIRRLSSWRLIRVPPKARARRSK